MFKSNNILLKNVVKVSKAMNWETPPIFTGSGYYFTWEHKAEEDIKEIFEKTGIQCSLSSVRDEEGKGTLLVPEYNDFKSEKQKKLLLDLSQYGLTMFWLDLCKKSKPEDLKEICRTLFHEVSIRTDEDEFRKIIESIIDKIS